MKLWLAWLTLLCDSENELKNTTLWLAWLCDSEKNLKNMTLWFAWLCDSEKNWKKIWCCDWRDWRDYVIQKKTGKKFDVVIGVIDMIMWFRKKNWEKDWRRDSEKNWIFFLMLWLAWLTWLCESEEKKLEKYDVVIGVIDVIMWFRKKLGKNLMLWLAWLTWLCDSEKN